MSDSSKPCCPNLKQVLWTLAIFGLFGFLALIVSGRLDSKNPVNRAYEGEFTDERTRERWANLDEVKSAQASLVDHAKVDAALEALAKAPAKPTATDVVVPGSPTFLKQSQQPAPAAAPAPQPAPAGGAPAPAAPPAQAPAQPAPAPATPAQAAPAPAPSTPAPAPAPAPK
jgi:hypothetical protein